MKRYINSKGFTLLEILLVVAAIGILAGIVILAINPAEQLAKTRDAQRKADVNTILNAVYQYAIDNNGNLPATIGQVIGEICKTGSASCSGKIDLSVLTLNEKYLVAIPIDPDNPTGTGTGYNVKKSANNRVTVHSIYAEGEAEISVTR